ncbi:hypothetical protein P7L78_02600 (plasmid) [Tistrella bauzanensis]|uniref:Metallo-beta-lactamase domain-containing protein n=1 Tax=Tistrella arctica TaxID=3133430 RepID=A0ABU9YRZ3_9PROT
MTMTPTDQTDWTFDITTAARVTLNALWCDQGMAHMLLANEHEDEFIPDVIALFDFGATLNFITKVLKPAIAAPAVKSVVEALQSQRIGDRVPKLDLVMVSHQDDDHWRLLTYLMDELERIELPYTVGKIVYAGSDWGQSALNVLTRLATKTADADTDLVYFNTVTSSYKPANGTLGQMKNYGDIVIRTLAANTPSKFKAKSKERKNGSSAVMVIDYARERIILPGDATWETMAAMNKILAAWTTSPVQPVTAMSAPHHGSLNTATQSNDAGNDSDLSELIAFTELTRPNSVIASAGIATSHKHPHAIVLKKLIKYAGSYAFPAHPVVYYDLIDAEFKRKDEVAANLYTTVLGLTAPVLVANWHFTVTPTHQTVVNATGFYGACKALVSVPDTESNLIEMLIEDDEDEATPIVIDSDNLARRASHGTAGGVIARQRAARPARGRPAFAIQGGDRLARMTTPADDDTRFATVSRPRMVPPRRVRPVVMARAG